MRKCPQCKGSGKLPDVRLPDVGNAIARAAEREMAVTFNRVFCGKCGGAYWSGKDCPYCALPIATEPAFPEGMLVHRKKLPFVYDDALWLAQCTKIVDGQRFYDFK